jgi:hypothetical protein
MSFQICRCQQWKKNYSVAISILYQWEEIASMPEAKLANT